MSRGIKVVFVIAVSLCGTVAFMFSKRLAREERSNAYANKWDLRLEKVHKATEDTQHYNLSTFRGQAEWESTLPRGGGLLHLGPDDEVFSISLFHQLRCLNVLGREIAAQPAQPSALAKHCMNYLRQMILCRADTTLEAATNPYGPHIVVQDITHTCSDWSAVYAAAEENYERYEARRAQMG